MSQAPFPPERYVLLKDPRGTRWDGEVTKVCAGPHLERSVAPGEIAVFEPTGDEVPVAITEQLRGGPKVKEARALVYRRTRTRLVRVR